MNTRTLIVKTTEELENALKAASGGDTIKLMPGTYAGTKLRDLSFDSPVTIISQDVDNPAVFESKLALENIDNLHIDSVEFQMPEIPDKGANSAFLAMFYVFESSNISLTNSKITGLISDRTFGDPMTEKHNAVIAGLPAGYGISLRDVEGVHIANNEISTVYQAIVLQGTKNVTIEQNYLHDMRSDGIVGSEQTNTVISENLFVNLHPYIKDPENPSGSTDDHADFIQYWGIGSQSGIDGFYVRDNIFVQEEGRTQTIFGRLALSGSDPDDITFTNFEISGNLIYNGHRHGITLGDVTGAKVFNNTLLPNSAVLDDFRILPSINLSYDGVAAGSAAFDITSDDVQATRDIDIYNNVGFDAYGAPIGIKAYKFGADNLDEVKSALDIREWGNVWLPSKGITSESYAKDLKFGIKTYSEQLTFQIDPNAADLYGGAGSKYHSDPDSLKTFLSNLGLDAEATVGSLGFVTGADVPSPAPSVEAQAEPVVEAQAEPVVEAQAEPVVEAQAEPVVEAQAEPVVAKSDDIVVAFDDGADAYDVRLRRDTDSTAQEIVLSQSFPAEQATQEEPPEPQLSSIEKSNDMIAVILDGDPAAYDIYLNEDGSFTITDLKSGIRDHVEEIDVIFFKDSRTLYEIDAATGETVYLEAHANRGLYHDLLKINNLLNDQDDFVEAQLLESASSDDLLLADAGVDFISGTSGKDIILAQDSHATILGHGSVDTLVMEGRAEQYAASVNADGTHSFFSAQTGRLTSFVDVEQIYFTESDQLHFVDQDSTLPPMSKTAYSDEYARIEQALTVQEPQEDVSGYS